MRQTLSSITVELKRLKTGNSSPWISLPFVGAHNIPFMCYVHDRTEDSKNHLPWWSCACTIKIAIYVIWFHQFGWKKTIAHEIGMLMEVEPSHKEFMQYDWNFIAHKQTWFNKCGNRKKKAHISFCFWQPLIQNVHYSRNEAALNVNNSHISIILNSAEKWTRSSTSSNLAIRDINMKNVLNS